MNAVDQVLSKMEELATAEAKNGDGRALRFLSRYAPQVRVALSAAPSQVTEQMVERTHAFLLLADVFCTRRTTRAALEAALEGDAG